MTIQIAFTALLNDVQTALQESLARSNTAAQQGDFDTVELEVERQKNLINIRNQLQTLQEMWREVVGERMVGSAPADPTADQSETILDGFKKLFEGGGPEAVAETLNRVGKQLGEAILMVAPSSLRGAAKKADRNIPVETGSGTTPTNMADPLRQVVVVSPPSQIETDRQQSFISSKRGTTQRLPKGMKTTDRMYYLPILTVLTEMGGKGNAASVLKYLEKELADSFTEFDLSIRQDGQPRWRNTAQWARLRMVKIGLLASDSPYGIWEITDKGRTYLQEHTKLPPQ